MTPSADNPLVSLAVGAMTEGLRLAGVGADEYRAATTAARAAGPTTRPLRRGDVAGLMRTLRRDFLDNSYFVTGVLDNAEIYSPDCLFADPTISFRGRDLYVRNLSLLVPFLVEPRIELKSLRQLPSQGSAPRQWQWPWLPGANAGSRQSSSGGGDGTRKRSSRGSRGSRPSSSSSGAAEGTRLFAEWRLTCYVRLPWAPFVEVNGTTTYTLNSEENQIVSHVEAWDITPTQALLLLLRPSERVVWRAQQRATQQRATPRERAQQQRRATQ